MEEMPIKISSQNHHMLGIKEEYLCKARSRPRNKNQPDNRIRADLPTFCGHLNTEAFLDWTRNINKTGSSIWKYPKKKKVRPVTYKLKSGAYMVGRPITIKPKNGQKILFEHGLQYFASKLEKVNLGLHYTSI